MIPDQRSRRATIVAIGSVAFAGFAGCSESPSDGMPTGTAAETETAGGTTESPDETTGMGDETETEVDTDTVVTATPTGTDTTTEASGVTEVAVGPEGRLRFDPETVDISVGDTVRWTFESAGHNVTAKAGASEKVSIPDDAEPFASYEGDQHYAIDEVGSTYEHTFEVPGEYVYVCEPHEDQGMVGTVQVVE